ncbi:hypothetical protein WMF31_03105 [Sorangium sp. So ce1036]|uniref:hypothetical protein n=1 Tax=Sorangium sp. So ce1036 TaxID=3133328 RepID=UPI003F11AB6A
MKVQLCAAALCALFVSVGAADANDEESMDELERQAYDVGWDAANSYCKSLVPGFSGALRREMETITERFKRACKKGYDDYIDSNRSCQQRLRETGRYREMWEARNNTCS